MTMKKYDDFFMNVENLTKLRDYLMSLPRSYKDFHMGSFATVYDDGRHWDLDEDDSILVEDYAMEIPANCGTSACAVGHGPNAGIKHRKNESWERYSARTMIHIKERNWDGSVDTSTSCTEWHWCFSGYWDQVDDHHWGAARRISYLIKHKKVPDWF